MSIYGDGIVRVSDVLDAWNDGGEGLMNWAASVGYSWKQLKQHAADVGTHAHTVIQKTLADMSIGDEHAWRTVVESHYHDLARTGVIEDSMIDEVQKSLDGFIAWSSSQEEVRAVVLEETIVNDDDGIGGTCDFKGYVNGSRVMLDWKTSKRVGRKYKVQLAAYHLLHEYRHGVDDAGFDFFGVIRFDKRFGTFEDHYWRDLSRERMLFLALFEAHKISREVQL